MHYFRLSTLAVLACRLLPVLAQADKAATSENDEIPLSTPNLNVQVSTSFPASEIFGVKLVNGQPSEALVSVKNGESFPVSVAFVGGNLWAPNPRDQGATSVNVRNLTSTRYNVKIPAGESDSVSYKFSTELHAQDLRLQLVTILTTDKGEIFTLGAFNETVSIVEPDASFFDPQLIFLYVMLAGLFGASVFFIYNTWLAALFPAAAKGGKDGSRAKKSSQGTKKVDPTKQVLVGDADGPAVATGAYDASWIPEHHMNKPEAKRTKSGGGASIKTKKV